MAKAKARSRSAAVKDPLDGLPDLYGEGGRVPDLPNMIAFIQRQLALLRTEQETEMLGDEETWISPQTQRPVIVSGKPLTYGGRRATLENSLRRLVERNPKDVERIRRAEESGNG